MKSIVAILATLSFALAGHGQTFEEMMNHPASYNFYQIKAAAEAHFDAVGREKGSGYKQYKRWETFMEPRVYPTGNFVNVTSKALEAYKDYVQSTYYQSLPAEKVTNGYWTSLGPENYANTSGWNGGHGRVNVIAVHPTNSSIIYAGTPAGGLWRSNDQGLSWTCLTDGMPIIGVSGIAIRPTNPNIMYILTGDGDGGDTPSIGVLKTVDGGATWKTTGLTFNANVRPYKLVMRPGFSTTLFAVTSSGIQRTTDGGVTWTTVQTGDFRDLVFKPGDNNTVYAVSTTTYFRSTDGGETFATVSGTGLPNSDFDRIAIGVTAANADYVYLLYGGGSTGYRGLYRSTNGGTTFTLRSSTPNIFGYEQDGSGTKHLANYDIAIAVSPTNAELVMMGGINVWRSSNGGTTWTIRSYWYQDSNSNGNDVGYTHADIHYLGYSGSTLWVGSDGGVYRSTNNGDSWVDRSAGLRIMQFYRICTRSGNTMGGTQDNGTNLLSNSSPNATHIRGGDGFECIFHPSDNTKWYASTQDKYYRRTAFSILGFELETWSDITPDQFNQDPWNVAWLMSPSNTNRLFLGYFGTIYRSNDEGNSWTNLSAGFSSENRVNHMHINNSNSNRLYAASLGAMRRSDNCNDASPTFTNITAGLPVGSAAISGIAVDATNSNRVWVSFSGYSNNNKVFFSSNAGSTWTNISGTLPNVPVNCIVYEGNGVDGVYIGTDIGVFYRNNTLNGWIPFGNGLPSTIVNELEVRVGESRIYAGTFGRGMWRSDLYTACPTSHTLTAGNDPSNPNYTGYQFYEASSSITSSRVITGGVGTDVTYRAGSFVQMNEGFWAREDNLFKAEIGSCNNVFSPIIPPVPGVLVGAELSVNESDELQVPQANEVVSFDVLQRMPTRVYPNPFTNNFTVEVAAFSNDRTFSMEIFDLSGKLVKAFSTYHVPEGNRLTLDVDASDLAKGTYLIKLAEGDRTENLRVVKQ